MHKHCRNSAAHRARGWRGSAELMQHTSVPLSFLSLCPSQQEFVQPVLNSPKTKICACPGNTFLFYWQPFPPASHSGTSTLHVRARIWRDGGVYTCCTLPPEACLSLHVHDPLCALVTSLVTLCFMQIALRVGQASVCLSVHSHLTDRCTAHASSLRPRPAWEVLGEGALLAALHQAAR